MRDSNPEAQGGDPQVKKMNLTLKATEFVLSKESAER